MGGWACLGICVWSSKPVNKGGRITGHSEAKIDAGRQGAHSWELKQTPSQQGNAEGGGVGHLEVASNASLNVPPSNVPVQGPKFIGHGI